MNWIILAAAATAALSVMLLFAGGVSLMNNRRGAVASRLQRWGSSAVDTERQERQARKKARTQGDMSAVGGFAVALVNRAVARQSFAETIARRLARADIKITVGEFLIINASSTLLGLVIGAIVFSTIIHGIVFTLAGIILPHWYIRMKQRSRLKKFNLQLGDTITMLANSLRSGFSMLQSMEMVGREMPTPICDEFIRVTREVGLGLTPEEALANLVRRINSVDLELMVTAVNVQREVGGNLAEILDIIANTIRERVKLQGEIKTLTAQQTMAGYVITGLPIGLFFFLYTIDPKYIGTFWTWVPCGWIMSGTTILMMGVGYFVMRKIVAIDV